MADNKSARKVIDLPIDDILPNRYQPRIKFDDNSIYELSESIKTHGVFQPILVRPIGDKYEIIAGERRYKASVLANRTTIPAIIMSLNDKDTVEIALIENVQRSDLTPIEEAISYKKILDMGYIKQEDLAHKLGKTQSTIANKLRLLNLDEDIQEALMEGKISERHARSLLRIKNFDDQKLMLKRIINERLTVRRTDEEIEKMLDGNNNIDDTVVIDIPTTVENQTNNQFIPNNEVVEEVIPEIITNPVNNVPNSDISSIPQMETSSMNESSSPIFGFSGNSASFQSVPASVNESTVISSTPAEKVESVDVTQTDINKIENEAMPVYEERPLADMDALLKPANDNIVEQASITPQPSVESTEDTSSNLNQGKFFNFASEAKEENTPITDNNTGAGFNFNNFVATPPAEQPQNQQNQISSFDDFFKNQHTTPMNSEPEIVIPASPQYTNFETDTAASNIQSDPTIIIPNNFSNPSVIQAAPEVQQANVIAEPVISSQVQPQKNVMSAVNVIRNAISQLESMGYSVDVDEIDLESIYQLIIKIDKE